jgi:hypothetical protein
MLRGCSAVAERASARQALRAGTTLAPGNGSPRARPGAGSVAAAAGRKAHVPVSGDLPPEFLAQLVRKRERTTKRIQGPKTLMAVDHRQLAQAVRETVEAVKTNIIVSLDFDSVSGALERVEQLGPVDTRAATPVLMAFLRRTSSTLRLRRMGLSSPSASGGRWPRVRAS